LSIFLDYRIFEITDLSLQKFDLFSLLSDYFFLHCAQFTDLIIKFEDLRVSLLHKKLVPKVQSFDFVKKFVFFGLNPRDELPFFLELVFNFAGFIGELVSQVRDFISEL